jgi:cysteinyl-tRNA synthetase
VFDILGIQSEDAGSDLKLVDGLMQTIINLRQEARAKKDFATSDVIRDSLGKLSIVLKDGKEGTSWELK